MDKLLLMQATGSAPDVIMIEAFWIPLLVEYDVLLPLDDWVGRDPDFALEDFEPVLFDAFRSGGALYGLPKDYSTLALYCNPDMFEDAGLAFPPRNWEEFAEFARRFTRDTDGDARTDQYGYSHAENLEYSLPFVWQNGGKFIDGRRACHFCRARVRRGAEFPSEDEDRRDCRDALGRRGCVELGRVRPPARRHGDLGLVGGKFPERDLCERPIPGGFVAGRKETGNGRVRGGLRHPQTNPKPGVGLATTSLSHRAEGGRIWAKSAIGLPARRSVAQEPAIEHDPVKKVFLHSLDHARVWQFRVNQRILDETDSALQAIFFTDAAVQPTLYDLKHRVERRRRFHVDVSGDEKPGPLISFCFLRSSSFLSSSSAP